MKKNIKQYRILFINCLILSPILFLAILCYNMHGDRMKKNIKVNYKSIFKYDDHHETVQFKSDGIYRKGFDKENLLL